MDNKRKVVLAAIIVALSAMTYSFDVSATADDGGPAIVKEQSSFVGVVKELTFDADAYASKDTSSEVKMSFYKGDSVMVIGESDGWYEIFYGGETLYLQDLGEGLEDPAVAESDTQEEEVAALDDEFEAYKQQDAVVSEAFVRQQRAEKNALIWKIVIAVLVVAIIAVSIVIALKNKKTDDDTEWDN